MESLKGNAPEKKDSPKPFWGPPIGTPPTPWPAHYSKATPVPIGNKEEFPVRLPNNAVNTRQGITPGNFGRQKHFSFTYRTSCFGFFNY